jgi:hypothetical protein
MPTTFTKIAAVSVGSGGASSIDFTSIPSTYTDLLIVLSARSARSDVRDSAELTFNNNTSNYTTRTLRGNGSSVDSGTGYSSSSINRPDVNGATSTANSFSNISFYISNYAGSNNKSVSIDSVFENNATEAWQILAAGLWSDSAAITSAKLEIDVSTFVQYSTATLYGIKNS